MSKLVEHLKGPKQNGQRQSVYFPTHVDFVEGIESISGSGGGGIKGTVATYDSLPANAAVGDMYLITDTGNLAYFADSWKVCLTSNDIWLDTLDGGS